MIVADTSALCYLVLIGCVDVLPAMFGRVEIPEAVRDELSADDAPPDVAGWIEKSPEWLGVYAVGHEQDAALRRLHRGEREAIILAERLGADLIVLDEKFAPRRGRARAEGHRHARHFERGFGPRPD